MPIDKYYEQIYKIMKINNNSFYKLNQMAFEVYFQRYQLHSQSLKIYTKFK